MNPFESYISYALRYYVCGPTFVDLGMPSLQTDDFAFVNAALSRYADLDPDVMLDVVGKVDVIEVKKGQVLVHAGDHSEDMYFVLEGVVRAYTSEGGKAYIDWFALPGMFVTAITSYFTGCPSQHHYDVIVPGRLMRLHKQDVDALLERHRGMERMYREVLAETLLITCERLVTHRYKTAQERYAELVEKSPELLQLVPLKHLAEYLAVSPETLSRIRGKI